MANSKEGAQLIGGPSAVRRRVSSHRFVSFYLLVVVATLAAVYGTSWYLRPGSPTEAVDLGGQDPELVWSTVPPTPVDNLVWIACYKDLQCAKMTVPLDYADPEGPKAIIAMVKAPAKVPPSDARYRGPILFNPGGPGGSGVDEVVGRFENMRGLLGDEYDFVGFDPRGVGRTIPHVNIFPDVAEATRWYLQISELPLPNSIQNAVSRLQAQYKVYGKLAELRTANESPYVSTALVCRDMLNMMRAHGREKIQYWGFSYGTVLGATFAAMFPDNVERLVIDGVEDAVDYYATLWSNNMVDTDKVLDWFFEECAEAGPQLCALHDDSASKIKKRFMNVLASLKTSPMPVTTTSLLASPADYGVVDYTLALEVLFQFTYSPYPIRSVAVAPADIASAFAAVEKGDPVPLWNLHKNNTVEFKCSCGPMPPVAPLLFENVHAAIACTDGDPVDDTVEELQTVYNRLIGDSMFGVLWRGRARCSGWKIRSVERFNGPFVGNTSYPILLIGNTADPVTPVINAHNTAKGYNGSVVLTQHSAGVTLRIVRFVRLSATSKTLDRLVHKHAQVLCLPSELDKYHHSLSWPKWVFDQLRRDGKLPEPGTVCEVESKMFPKDDASVDDEAWLSDIPEDERGAVKAWKELSDMFVPPRYGW